MAYFEARVAKGQLKVHMAAAADIADMDAPLSIASWERVGPNHAAKGAKATKSSPAQTGKVWALLSLCTASFAKPQPYAIKLRTMHK